MQSADNLNMFTDWKKPRMTSVWIGQRYDPTPIWEGKAEKPDIPREFFGSKHIDGVAMHPDGVHDPVNCTTAGHGSWVYKSCHFLPDGKPSTGGREIQLEYYIPYKKFMAALFKLYKMRDVFVNLVQVTEIRMMDTDRLPMS